MAKNYCINIHIILLGHKPLVCYLYLICLWEIQYFWCCARVRTGILISQRSWEQTIYLKCLIAVSIVWHKFCFSYYYYHRKNPDIQSPNSSHLQHFSDVTDVLWCSLGDAKFYETHTLVPVLHASGCNCLHTTRFRPGVMQEAPRVMQKSSSALTHVFKLITCRWTCCFKFPDLSLQLFSIPSSSCYRALPHFTSKPLGLCVSQYLFLLSLSFCPSFQLTIHRFLFTLNETPFLHSPVVLLPFLFLTKTS